jgi:hypothetical protein
MKRWAVFTKEGHFWARIEAPSEPEARATFKRFFSRDTSAVCDVRELRRIADYLEDDDIPTQYKYKPEGK